MPATTHAASALPGLSSVAGKPIVARFDGGSVSSDGGLLALREVEARLGVAWRLGEWIDDPTFPPDVAAAVAVRRKCNTGEQFIGLPRKVAERTVEGVWNAIGRIIDAFTPGTCTDCFSAAAGNDPA